MVSPLLANLHMNRFLKHWRVTGKGQAYRARVINYADDFVILGRGHAAEALAWTDAVMTRLGLSLNREKTAIRDARYERFDFLGYSFGPHCHPATGQRYLAASPSKKSLRRLKVKVNAVLRRGDPTPWPELRDRLNRLLVGWAGYFSYGARSKAYEAVDRHVSTRVRLFLARRHKDPTRGSGRLGIVRPQSLLRRTPHASA